MSALGAEWSLVLPPLAFVDVEAALLLPLLAFVGVSLAVWLVVWLARKARPRTGEGRTAEVKPTGTAPSGQPCPQCGAALPAGALAGLCPACLLRQGAASDSGTQPRSAPFEPPTAAEIARLFPQLEVLELLGKGGMGAVYKARQPALDRVVALKVLPSRPGAAADFAERFAREARALAKLNHPNIVAVYEFGQVEGLHYFVMEYVDGTTLRQMERTGPLSPRQALAIIPAICDALQYAHDEGVVHRDIKPENVLVDRRGRVKIADFGLARILGADPGPVRLTGEGQVMGTPHYMAPEQIEHPLDVDHRADIFALGVVFYEMLTGELPLGKFPPPSQKVRVDVRLDEVVLRSLEKEPERRYQHAREVGTAVETIAHTPAVAAGATGVAVAAERLSGPNQPGPRWPLPLVGVRAGQRAVHWPGVVLFAALVACVAGLGAPLFCEIGQACGLRHLHPGRGVGLGLALGLALLVVRLIQAWQKPVTDLPRLDAPPGPAPAGARWCLALVGVRHGRRVVHWPGMLLVACLLVVAVVIAVKVLSEYLLGPAASGTGLSVPGGLALVTVPVALLLAIQWFWHRPLEQLPCLDRPRSSATPAPEVTEELLRQVRRPAVGLFAAGVANWVLIPLLAMPLLYLSALSQGESGPRPALMLVLLLAACVLSGIVFVAALRMMRLQSYRLAIVAAILAMVVTPGNIIGFPIGIWALVVLLRPEVRAAFDTGRPLPTRGARTAAAGGANGSKRAAGVVAAILGYLAVLGVLLLGLVLTWRLAAGRKVAATAAQFERSEYQRQAATRGASAQLTPASIHRVLVERDRAAINGQGRGNYSLVLQIGATGTAATWSAGVGQGPLTAFDATVALMAPDSPRLQFAVTRRGGGVAQYIDLATVPGLPQGRVVFRTGNPDPEADGSYVVADLVPESGPALPISVCVRPTREVAVGAVPGSSGFGPVVEKTIDTEDADSQGLVFLDLETGHALKPPLPLTCLPGQAPAFVELTPELLAWVRAQDVDLLLQLGDRTWDLMTLEMQQDVVGQFCEWETVTPEAVAAVFARKDTAGQVRDLVPASSFGHAYRDGLGPVTAFRTRRSALGEYQVEGIENDTRKGVGIRYRLVQGPGQGVAAPLGVVAPGTMRVLPGGVPPEAPGASSTLGPEIEREFRLRRPAEPAGEGAGASAAAGPGPMGGGIGLGGSPTSGRSTGTPPGPGLPGGLEPGRTAKPGIFAPGAPASVLVVCREVNRSVADFPEPVDLSTPESACAAWHRAGPRLDVEAWSRLTWVPFDIAATRAALHAETEKDAPAMAAYLKAVADATIVEVLNWGADLAATVTCLPLPAGMDTRPYSARVFGRINGQWKNMGEDRLPTQEAARASFEAKKEALWQQYQDLAEKLAPAAPQPPEGK